MLWRVAEAQYLFTAAHWLGSMYDKSLYNTLVCVVLWVSLWRGSLALHA